MARGMAGWLRSHVGFSLWHLAFVIRADAESKYAGDRDVRYLNCVAPCTFECDQTGQRARWYMAHEAVKQVWRKQGMGIEGFDMYQHKEAYLEALQNAFRAAASKTEMAPPTDSGRFAMLTSEMSWPLRAWRWDCPENCKYECMIENRELRQQNGEQQVQYKGKWAFIRVVGTQEFFSSLFSFLNGLPHLIFLIRHARNKQAWSRRGSGALLSWFIFALNAWVQSGIFHARDNPTTETLDYIGA